MADGFLNAAVCYGLQEQAMDARLSAGAPSHTAGSTAYVSEFVKEAGVWRLKVYSADAGGQLMLRTDAVAPAHSFPSCDTMESFKDGQVLGWGVVAAMVAAWCIASMRRGL
jgi:hypothetical protein